jgi:hypothetical protein
MLFPLPVLIKITSVALLNFTSESTQQTEAESSERLSTYS